MSFLTLNSPRVVLCCLIGLCPLLLGVSGFTVPLRNNKNHRKTFGRPERIIYHGEGINNDNSNSHKSKTQLFGSAVTSEQEHAREVFKKFETESGTIDSYGLGDMLRMLDIDATREEADALYKYLDKDGDGQVQFDEFLPWYSEAADIAKDVARNFQALLVGRRTVDLFDQTPVADDVLKRAVQCAIAAPNRSMSEPWRFIKVGSETVAKLTVLNNKSSEATDNKDWTKIPGWCVVTTKLSPDDPETELEDFKSISCAVQNFMLSMWSEGIGCKWTSGPVQKSPEFADLCGVDTSVERVAGCIWYGFASGGLVTADPKRRKKGLDDVLSTLP